MKLKCIECSKMEAGHLTHAFRASGKMFVFCRACHSVLFSDTPEGLALREKYPKIF